MYGGDELSILFFFGLLLLFYSVEIWSEVAKNNEPWERSHACIQCKQVDMLPTT